MPGGLLWERRNRMSGVTEAILTARDLSIGYRSGRRPPRVVASAIDVTLDHGEFVCLLGPNGTGKSTLMRTLAGMQPPLNGHVNIGGRDIAEMSATEVAQLLSVVLTDRVNAGAMTARDLVGLGRYPHTDWIGRFVAEDQQSVSWAIRAAGAGDLEYRNVAELSDGERQRVMIARALAQQPDLMILDEPTAFLDLPRRVEIMALLRNLAHTTRKAILLSTHDLDLALRSADRIYLLPSEGALQTGAPEDLVLNGAFERAFGSDGVHFDADSGAFVLTPERGRATLSVSGAGRNAYWTRRALERAGFRLSDGASGRRIDVLDGETVTWRFERDENTEIFYSIYDLISAIKFECGIDPLRETCTTG